MPHLLHAREFTGAAHACPKEVFHVVGHGPRHDYRVWELLLGLLMFAALEEVQVMKILCRKPGAD